MRIAFDTNVLVYAEGAHDRQRQSAADRLILLARQHDAVLPVQVTAEFFHFLVRKRKMTRQAALSVVTGWQDLMTGSAATTSNVFSEAMQLASGHNLQIFDAIILASAAESECRMLLSEDMQDGFVWRGVTVVNPFAATPHPMLADLMRP